MVSRLGPNPNGVSSLELCSDHANGDDNHRYLLVDVTSYTYDLDKKLETVMQPGNRLIAHDYDAAGRLSETTFPGGDTVRTYSPTTGKLTALEGPYGVDLSFTHDGSLLKSTSWSGDIAGSVAWTHDSDFRVVGETINGGNAVTFGYDADSLLTSAGELTIQRDPASGRVTTPRAATSPRAGPTTNMARSPRR